MIRKVSAKRKASTVLRFNSTIAVSKPKPKERMTVEQLKASGLLKKASQVGGKSERSKAMKEADRWFSQFIRLRDADEYGMCACITNPKTRRHWKQMDCGHWISRAKMAVRYDERNANAQSKQSNRFQGGHFMEHGLAIERIHGYGTRELLEAKVRMWDAMGAQMKTADFQFIAATYRSRVDRIKETEPGRYFGKGA